MLTAGNWEAGEGGVLVIPGDMGQLGAAQVGLTGEGSAIVDTAGQNALAGLRTVGNGAALAIVNGAALATNGNLVNRGTIDVGRPLYPGGSLAVKGGYIAESGSFTFVYAGTVTTLVRINPGAALEAGGTIFGYLFNFGSVSTLGTLKVTGNYIQAPAATLAAGNVGTLQVLGSASLSGTLNPSSFLPPAPGTRSVALSFSSRAGNFTQHSLGFVVIAGATQVVVVAEPQIALSTSSVPPGGTLGVQGAGFQYESTMKLFLDTTTGTPLQSVGTDVHGVFLANVTIPDNTTAGAHRLIAVGADGRRAHATFQVS